MARISATFASDADSPTDTAKRPACLDDETQREATLRRLAQGDIANVMRTALNHPVPTPGRFEQGRAGLIWRQIGHAIGHRRGHFARLVAVARAGSPEDVGGTRPAKIGTIARGDLQGTRLVAPVAVAACLHAIPVLLIGSNRRQGEEQGQIVAELGLNGLDHHELEAVTRVHVLGQRPLGMQGIAGCDRVGQIAVGQEQRNDRVIGPGWGERTER
jgi:hypothetical protein